MKKITSLLAVLGVSMILASFISCSDNSVVSSNEKSQISKVDCSAIAKQIVDNSISGEKLDAMALTSDNIADIFISVADLNNVEDENVYAYFDNNRNNLKCKDFSFTKILDASGKNNRLNKTKVLCDCYIYASNSRWNDPNNPGEDHVVAWFQCDQVNNYPIVRTTVPWSGYVRNWMVWSNGNNKYQVFIDGVYYWGLRAIGWTSTEVFYSVSLE
jgi:hypothetical protein